MSGIILLVVLTIWFYIVKKLSEFCVIKMPSGSKKSVVKSLIFVLLFIAPVADDIIGGFQFRALCKPENLLVYAEEKLRGKSVKPRSVPPHTINKILTIFVSTGQWEDSETGELLVTYRIYEAGGGWLSRLIGFPQGSPPYTFNGYCMSKEYYQLFTKLNVTKIEN